MQEVAQELQAIRQPHKEEIETQRREFVIELKKVNKRLHQVEMQSIMFKNEIKALKTQKYILSQ